MTDKEIIKASKLVDKLRDAYNDYYDTSKSMPYDIDTTLRESAICLENALNEINRQQAEIEKKQKLIDRLHEVNEQLYEEMSERQKEEVAIAKRMARKKAIKEFAERYTESFITLFNLNYKQAEAAREFKKRIIKEMEGDNK